MNYKLGIAILYVRDLKKETQFYRDTVGLSLVEQGSDEHFVLFALAGEALLGLEDIAVSRSGNDARPGCTELGLVVEDVDAVYRDWQSKSVPTLTALQDMPFGRSFDARDPEGHLLNIYQPRAN